MSAKTLAPKEIQNEVKKQLNEKTRFLQTQFKEHTSTAIIAALSFIIALSWKDLVLQLVDTFLKPHTILITYPYLSELISAVILTLFAIIGITLVSRWAKKPEKE